MRGLWSGNQGLRVAFLALAMLSFLFWAPFTISAVAEDVPGGPDTPVSSDGSVPAATTDAATPAAGGASGAAGSAEPAQVSPWLGRQESALTGSQVKKKASVSHEQEAKDRLFVDAIFIAVAIVLCVIAFLLFMSLPKPPKKTGGDGQQEM